MDSAAAQGSQACPKCGATVPVLHGYLSWCGCGWNLTAPARHRPRGRVDAVLEGVGRRLGDRLARELLAADRLEPRLTPARAAAYAIAVGVHLLTLFLLVGGAALAVLAFPNILAIAGGVVMVLTGFLMRPRFGKPEEGGLVDRGRAPVLHGLVDEIASALGTEPIDVLVVSPDFNASWAVVGLRQQRELTLGLPLLAALEPEERVALIAHELAHARNGDAARGRVVGTAVSGLAQLYGVLAPGWGGSIRSSELAILEPVVNAVLWVVSRPALGLLELELHLLLRDRQRAEYLADAFAAEVAGTDASVGLQEKLLLSATADQIVRRNTRARLQPGELVDVLRAGLAAVPERERERRRRVARLEQSRLDSTHPPTGLRIRMAEERPRLEPAVVLDAGRSAAIDRELRAVSGPLEERMIDDARDALYYG